MAFPTTGILDTFTRADSLTTLGANWTMSTNANWGNGIAGISSNTAYQPLGDAGNGVAGFWNVNSFSGSVEAYVKFTTISDNYPIGVSFATAASSNPNGYMITWRASTGKVSIIKMPVYTSLWSATQSFNVNDSIGANIDSLGNISVYYKAAAGGWTNIGSFNDTSYSCGYVGLIINGVGNAVNFGGGKQVSAGIMTPRGWWGDV